MIYSCSSDSSSGGIETAPLSGYQYKVYASGAGEQPAVGDYVYFQMDIYDDKDTLLQTYRNQKQIPSVKIAPEDDAARKKNPVVDVLSHLSVGDSVGIIIPKDSLPNVPPGFEDVNDFYYNIVVEEVVDEATYKQRLDEEREAEMAQMSALKERLPEVEDLVQQTIKDYKAGKIDVQETETGLKYYIHEKGDGDLPQNANMLTMQYYGALVEDGKMFDNSFNRGRGFTFRVGQGSVIAGWDQAALVLPVGTKASLFIPSELGYGEGGYPPDIPGGAELYFYVEAEELFY